MGHQVVLIVGDWTAQIGDPSGQSVMRPMLTAEQVKANAETYMQQFFHIVDREQTEVRWQTEWFGRDKFGLEDVMRLASRFTVAQILQREDFRERFEAHQPLGIHELLYPLLQAYDSIAIEADVEFGGSDQRFNMLVGRELQEKVGQRPQAVFIMHLLVGTDGQKKMSKSLGNTIDFEDPPGEKYGKVMSIPDAALLQYLELATDIPDEELRYIAKQFEERAVNPIDVKERLAREIVEQFHGKAAATEAGAMFRMTYRARKDEDVIFLPADAVDLVLNLDGGTRAINLAQVLSDKGLVESVSAARRLIAQGSVDFIGWSKDNLSQSIHRKDAWRVEEPKVVVEHGQVFRVGKHRFLRIVDADRASSETS
jgi:tyrosyl-tRNA synthetase